jgi:hypothetical protein
MLLVVLTLPLVSCDSGGSSGEDTPDWVGTWQRTSDDGRYLDQNQERIKEVEENRSNSGCKIEVSEVLEVDENVITIEIPEGVQKARLEVSGDVQEATIIRNDADPDSEGETTFWERVDGDPEDLAGCAE